MTRSGILNPISITLIMGSLLFATLPLASEEMHMEKRGEHSMGTEAGHMEGREEHAEQMERHGHESWVTPPHAYADKRNPDWDDPQAVVRGMAVFAQQCAQCHGVSGIGDGPLAGGLVHRPADLSKHFHAKDGISDAYLFWRVSEGGGGGTVQIGQFGNARI